MPLGLIVIMFISRASKTKELGLLIVCTDIFDTHPLILTLPPTAGF